MIPDTVTAEPKILRKNYGVWVKTSGTKAMPMAKPKEVAMIKILQCVKSTVERIRIPAVATVATVANSSKVTPPTTSFGNWNKGLPVKTKTELKGNRHGKYSCVCHQ